MQISLDATPALNLSLRGSTGSFKVTSPSKKETLEVKYFLTHVGLNFENGSDDQLLKELAPVREIFDFKDLDFDEIMQRDIDDARVSSELIPYILDDKTKNLLKFFPPIVVIVLPIASNAIKPDDKYPEVTKADVEFLRSGVNNWRITRAGKVGGEVFQFDQPISAQGISCHE